MRTTTQPPVLCGSTTASLRGKPLFLQGNMISAVQPDLSAGGFNRAFLYHAKLFFGESSRVLTVALWERREPLIPLAWYQITPRIILSGLPKFTTPNRHDPREPKFSEVMR